MSKGIKILYVLPVAVCLLWSSCIRDSIPPCPPLQVTLTVKDKNYFNIDDAVKLGLMERKAENLPFRDYVSTLYYIVHDAEGKVVAEQKNTLVDNDDQTQLITLPESLPYGKYTLTVWGNMKSDEPLGEDATTAEMEAVGAAANDIYLASATFDYRYGNEEHLLAMERTKGDLLIKAEGIPDNIDFSTKDIQDIYNFVDNGFQYSTLTDIHTELDWQEIRSEIKSETLMCPSPSYEGSTLSVMFIDKSAAGSQGRAAYYPTLEPQDINITMGRNEITILKYVYVDEGGSGEGDFEIYLRVNDNWELLHGMELD
ncbi:FimB/Mfa2 family fimbrial subunit [Phocaeicola plebeius]|uniref:FimB/Mfa2 family fimbrial subunit n=1 Tax=Phocaeicola plebeius TaxID=310297 RepID=UPI00241FF75E|nr:FimB/Mfa2 family fimbrial subunit [Phocaeicola plebeius]